MRSRNTIEYLGVLETIYNKTFNTEEYNNYKIEAGANAFTMSPSKWIKNTNAIGMVVKMGRNGGGTYAHKDIAFKFASWLSPEFELYIIKDYQRIKTNENSQLSLAWNLNREIAKINYVVHTDAIKTYLTKDLTPAQLSFKYANEADMLNVAIFNMTAKEWREANPTKKGNIRDYASLNQLLVLANMENYNAILIEKSVLQKDRIIELRKFARKQLTTLEKINNSTLLLESK